MDEYERIKLIILAIKYCQNAKEAGMPPSCYAKALREPIHFLWEIRNGAKYKVAKYRSKLAIGKTSGNGNIVYDHSIPFKYLQGELLELKNINHNTVKCLLEDYGVTCVITKAEDNILSSKGLSRKMPVTWDNKDPLARYKEVGIEVKINT